MTIFNNFSCLVDSNEPVPSIRGSWGMREVGDSTLHTTPCSRHIEDENHVVEKSWHTSEHFDGMSPHGGSFNLKLPKSHLKQGNGDTCLPSGRTTINVFNHQTASYYRHYEEENGVVKNWHTGEDDVVSPNSGRFSVETQGPHLNHGIDDNDLQTDHIAIKVFKKNINTLKKNIKQFEEEFETDFGHRPSHSEKRKNKEIRKYMSELSQARKELKQMKDGVSGLVSISSAQKSTTSRSQPIISGQGSAGAASTLQQVEEKLKEERSACGRQEKISEMTFNELQEEKTALQKALLFYENIHGRPKTREDRDLAKPLYDRHRQCKRNILRTGSRAKENVGDLAPIIEHETMYFTLDSPQHHGCIYQDEKYHELPHTIPTDEEHSFPNPSHLLDKGEKITCVTLGNVHSLPLHDLKNRKKEARKEKKRLRIALRDFEEQFEREYGQKFQKEDRGPLEQTYLDYKHSKAKLRFLEALLKKLEPTQY